MASHDQTETEKVRDSRTGLVTTETVRFEAYRAIVPTDRSEACQIMAIALGALGFTGNGRQAG